MEVLYYAEEGATFAEVYSSDELEIPQVEVPKAEPAPSKKGCKKSAEIMVATTSALSLAVMILRKKK